MQDQATTRRSREMIEVAYFISKYCEPQANKKPTPPRELGTNRWRIAYAMFYDSLGGGRTLRSFMNSLKNTRDVFDAWVDSGRVGWRQEAQGRPPAQLRGDKLKVFDDLEKMTRTEVWRQIRPFLDKTVASTPSSVIADITAQESSQADKRAKTEGGRKVYISYKAERNLGLRTDALKIHGYDCQVFGFNFGEVYGAWGRDFAEVHHVVQLGGAESGERETDPSTDLAVLCANCHRMIHRKRGIVLSISELRKKIHDSR